MKMKIVAALGGNALGENASEQKMLLKEASKSLADLIGKGYELVLVHGNGPQVGMINKAFNGEMPLAECTAMSQGYIGFQLQNALQNALDENSINRKVSTVITQVLVDENDQAFQNPEKPIGMFFSSIPEYEYQYMEDSNKGYRRVVASPKPLDIIEIDTIQTLINEGNVVVACGGGGIPVIRKNDVLESVDAVIDKDYASASLAHHLNADCLMILTEVNQVAINYGKENEEWLENLSIEKAKEYLELGHFGKGSMGPKVAAAIEFVEGYPHRQAIITSLKNAKNVMETKEKTVIKN